ncbi:NAD(+) diphosphatase [bacterium]|nr:NAD(+) diphosphatase [bacterium]
MLNEIAPNIFSNSYQYCRPPHPGDVIAAFTKQGVLKTPHGGFYRFSDLSGAPPEAFTHLIAVGNISVYCCDPELLQSLRPEAIALPLRRLRTYQPQWLAFAIATASHLAHWYRTNRYCGACAAPTQPSPKERALICTSCGFTKYPTISPAVIVAIHSGERLLLTHNPILPPSVRWALVAGYVEIGEALEDTVHREVAEEVGLKVKNLRYVCSQPWAFSRSLLMGFSAELDGPDTIKIDGVELDEARWFERGDIPPLPNTATLTNTLITAFKNKKL